MSVSDQPRRASATSRLARLGFSDPAGAARHLAAPVLAELGRDPLLPDALAASPDPDLALLGLVRLAETAPDRSALLTTLAGSKPLRDRLLGVLGASVAIGDHLARHPEDWHVLATYDVQDVQPTVQIYRRCLSRAVAGRTGIEALDALRVVYRRCLLVVAARDVCGTVDVQEVAAELADLASATLEAALQIARAELPANAAPCSLAVIGMGKCGGRELNYVSDVDVIFVAEAADGADEAAALRTATQLASGMMRVCSDTTTEGTIWPVDANLRPEGKSGPLVRSLTSHLAYYERWAKTWEFQALLKARPIAGDADLGERYIRAVTPLVWSAASREHFVEDVQAMRRRVVAQIPQNELDRQLKLGPGGLRDVEFAVQLLQLVHGRMDETLRSGSTLGALEALAAGGYVGRDDAAQMDAAYRFLRTMEHRIQLYRLRRTHTVPESEAELRRLGRSLGFHADPVGELRTEWRRHAREVRRLHEKLFYRPLLAAVARLSTGESRLTVDAARERLEALGYNDPAGALRHLQALTAGVSRRAAIQRTLLPVMLGWFADAADPDGGLLAFRQVSDALGRTHWYLRLLRDGGAAAENMARILASGRYAPDLLLRAPEAVALLGDPEGLRPRTREMLSAEILAAVGRAADPAAAVGVVRSIRRRELFRIAAADILGRLDVDAVGQALSDVTAVSLAGGLQAALSAEEARSGGPLPTRIAIIGMGRLGGQELGYGSDADVMFVHEPLPGVEEKVAAEAAHAVANELRRLLAQPAPDPPLAVDADLRPEGRAGPLVRTLASYAAYYERWGSIWENQALLRAAPVAGDEELGQRFMRLVEPLRWPADGITDAQVREIRRIKARVEAERLPRGADRTTHTKLGRGGLSDVEWTVQLLQLRHAAVVPGLRTTRTRAALTAAAEAGLIQEADAAVLDAAWLIASRIRNAIMIVRGRPSDSLPTDLRELTGIARYLGTDTANPAMVSEEYRRLTRRARATVERVFYQ